MKAVPIRRAAPRGRRSWHVLVVLILLIVGCMLVAPGVSSAHVRAKYRAQYKRHLTGLVAVFNTYATLYDNTKADSQARAAIMASMIGDPNQHNDLLAAEAAALQIYNDCVALPPTWNLSYCQTVNAFKAKAKRYFRTAKQQRRFRGLCDNLKAFAGCVIVLAMDHAFDSYRCLGSTDPPDLAGAAQDIVDGDGEAATGHEGFDARMAALRKML